MKPTWRIRTLLWFATSIAVYLFLSLAAAVFLAEGTVHLPRRAITHEREVSDILERQFHAELQDVSVTTEDGTTLRGWYASPPKTSGSTVLLLHGLTDNREGMSGFAEMFLAHGYAVLLPDSRAHGESGGDLASYGVKERYDIREWTKWARSQHNGCLYLFGESMGAAIALQAAPVAPEVCAVVAESPFSHFREIAYDRIEQIGGLPNWAARTFARPTLEFALVYTRLRYGTDLTQADPADAIARSQVPALLIAGTADHNISPRHAIAIHSRAPRQTELWEVAGADHGNAVNVAPKEFERRVIGWFDHHTSKITPDRGT